MLTTWKIYWPNPDTIFVRTANKHVTQISSVANMWTAGWWVVFWILQFANSNMWLTAVDSKKCILLRSPISNSIVVVVIVTIRTTGRKDIPGVQSSFSHIKIFVHLSNIPSQTIWGRLTNQSRLPEVKAKLSEKLTKHYHFGQDLLVWLSSTKMNSIFPVLDNFRLIAPANLFTNFDSLSRNTWELSGFLFGGQQTEQTNTDLNIQNYVVHAKVLRPKFRLFHSRWIDNHLTIW